MRSVFLKILRHSTIFRLRDRWLLSKSNLFDPRWYLATYPDVAASRLHPIDHYLRYGASERRCPSPQFDTGYYLDSYPDVAASNLNPLVHYLRAGLREGRAISKQDENHINLIAASGLFDKEWYRTVHPEVQSTGMDPIEHYLNYGAQAGYAPGPLFDSANYLKRHPDVAASGENPFLQFLKYGASENRTAQSCYSEPTEDRWGISKPVQLLHEPIEHPTIAVVVHVFYLEVFEEICDYLKNIPYRFNLLITTSVPDHIPAIKRIIADHRLDVTVFVKECRNRGRNFAPLLVEFADLIQHHDLMLHLHTKKSLHTRSEQSEWRKHLFKSLIGNRYLVASIIQTLNDTDANIGVLYPSTYSWMPYWAHHWLSNGHLIQHFYSKIGIKYSRPIEYIDFPVGSMFWARTKALKPLLAANWSYEDFPPEQGQNDGTIAHVIERSIVTVAQNQGYKFVEFDYHAGSFRYNWSRKNLQRYAERTKETLFAQIDEADTVSFDIFDTLITRIVLTPNVLQQYVGSLLSNDFPKTCANFFEVRKQSEEIARQRKSDRGDVTIDEIYNAFPTTSVWTTEAVAFAKQLELNLEKKSFRVREDLVEALRYARSRGKRVIAISDTYFTREFIDEVLIRFNIRDLLDDIYISSERGARKDRGDLWDLVISLEQFTPKRLLHIGDNEHSDAQLPGDRFLNTFHVMSPATLLAMQGIPVPADRDWQTDIILGPLAARYTNSPYLKNQQFRPISISNAEDFGYIVFGPIFFGFFSWLYTHPILRHLKHLYFLSREGYFLYETYKNLQQATKRSLPEASYFYCSRRAAISAAQGVKFDPAKITFGSGFVGTIAELLRIRIGLILPDEFDLDHTQIVLPDDLEYVENVLQILAPYIIEHGKQELEPLKAYCDECEMTNLDPVGIVDVGYSGSIQDALQTVLGKGLVGLYMATVEDVARANTSGGFALGCFADQETWATTKTPALKYGRLLEAFLTAPHGQVRRFEIRDGHLQPVFKQGGFSQSVFDVLVEIHTGAANYLKDLIDTLGADVLDLTMDQAACQATLNAVAQHDIVLSDKLANALALEDEFCGNGEIKVEEIGVYQDWESSIAVE